MKEQFIDPRSLIDFHYVGQPWECLPPYGYAFSARPNVISPWWRDNALRIPSFTGTFSLRTRQAVYSICEN